MIKRARQMPGVAQAERGGGHDAKDLVIQVCSIDDVDLTDRVDFIFLGGGVEVGVAIWPGKRENRMLLALKAFLVPPSCQGS
jgi:hypothetical protein